MNFGDTIVMPNGSIRYYVKKGILNLKIDFPAPNTSNGATSQLSAQKLNKYNYTLVYTAEVADKQPGRQAQSNHSHNGSKSD